MPVAMKSIVVHSLASYLYIVCDCDDSGDGRAVILIAVWGGGVGDCGVCNDSF